MNNSQGQTQQPAGGMEKKEEILRDLKTLRNYFGEHDKTMEQHRLYAIADNLLKSMIATPPPAPVGIDGCDCVNVEFGSYDNQIEVVPPPHMVEYYTKQGGSPTICLDACVVVEVCKLWKLGITTTGCCCGHNKAEGFIGVIESDIPRMKQMGYHVAYNQSRPVDEDSFIPKSVKYNEPLGIYVEELAKSDAIKNYPIPDNKLPELTIYILRNAHKMGFEIGFKAGYAAHQSSTSEEERLTGILNKHLYHIWKGDDNIISESYQEFMERFIAENNLKIEI